MSATLFANVSIFDGSGAAAFPGEVLVEGNRIATVARAPERIERNGATIIDGAGMTLMPGLVEAHAHLSWPSSVGRVITAMRLPAEEHLLITAYNARVLLDHGFTSAYSAGSMGDRFEAALRDEIAGGWTAGPRLVASSMERAPSGVPGIPSADVDHKARGPEAVRAFVKDCAAKGVDSIKFLLSSDDGFEPNGSQVLNYTEDEVAAAGEQARESGLWLACHSQAAEAVKRAVRHGFRILYHCSHADDEALDMIEAKKDTLFVAPAPGLLWSRLYEGEALGMTRAIAEQMGAGTGLERMKVLYPKMRKRGIRVLPGGDYGFSYNPIGKNARDLALFVDLFGYSPVEVLKAATQWGGELMGIEVGAVKPGYLADLLLVDGDPVRDIRLLQDRDNIVAIMKDGAFHKAPAARRAMPDRVAAE